MYVVVGGITAMASHPLTDYTKAELRNAWSEARKHAEPSLEMIQSEFARRSTDHLAKWVTVVTWVLVGLGVGQTGVASLQLREGGLEPSAILTEIF
jgi:hypothetical protein